VLDLDTTFCFFALHERRDSPRNTVEPDVDRQSSGLPAKSESQKALRFRLDGE
jgi:hypothetical protein